MKIIKTSYTEIRPNRKLSVSREKIVNILGFNPINNIWSFTTFEGEDCIIQIQNNKIKYGGSKEVINKLFYDKRKRSMGD